jgi:hypothetical protein
MTRCITKNYPLRNITYILNFIFDLGIFPLLGVFRKRMYYLNQQYIDIRSSNFPGACNTRHVLT